MRHLRPDGFNDAGGFDARDAGQLGLVERAHRENHEPRLDLVDRGLDDAGARARRGPRVGGQRPGLLGVGSQARHLAAEDGQLLRMVFAQAANFIGGIKELPVRVTLQ